MPPRNIRQGWAARSEDEKTVALTLWVDQAECVDGFVIYSSKAKPEDRSLGRADRMKMLRHTWDNCDGRFRVVWVVRGTPNKFIADPDLVMKIESLDEPNGFRARSVNGSHIVKALQNYPAGAISPSEPVAPSDSASAPPTDELAALRRDLDAAAATADAARAALAGLEGGMATAREEAKTALSPPKALPPAVWIPALIFLMLILVAALIVLH
jgi:hypothetical protein